MLCNPPAFIPFIQGKKRRANGKKNRNLRNLFFFRAAVVCLALLSPHTHRQGSQFSNLSSSQGRGEVDLTSGWQLQPPAAGGR